MKFDFAGKNFAVFGATGAVGLAVCKYLSNDCNASIVMGARDKNKLSVHAETINNLLGIIHVDVVSMNYTHLERIFADLLQKEIELDGFVYCIGIAPMQTISDFETSLAINTYVANSAGFLEILKRFAEYFCKGKTLKSAVAISSLANKIITYRGGAYQASKAALDSYVKVAAKEYMGNIRVNSISPGAINGDMFWSLCGDNEEQRNKIISRYPLGLVESKCVAELAGYLLSDSSRYVTGCDYLMDSGYLAWQQ